MPLMSVNKLSQITLMDRRTIAKRLTSMKASTKGEYESSEALRLIFAPESLDGAQEKAQLDRTRRELLELKKGFEEKRLLDAGEVKMKWASVVTTIRTRLLNIPSRLAIEVPPNHAPEVAHEAKKLIYEALTELSKPETYPTMQELRDAADDA